MNKYFFKLKHKKVNWHYLSLKYFTNWLFIFFSIILIEIIIDFLNKYIIIRKMRDNDHKNNIHKKDELNNRTEILKRYVISTIFFIVSRKKILFVPISLVFQLCKFSTYRQVYTCLLYAYHFYDHAWYTGMNVFRLIAYVNCKLLSHIKHNVFDEPSLYISFPW